MASLVQEWRHGRASRADDPARDITTTDDFALTMGQMYAGTAAGFGFGPAQLQWMHEPAEQVQHSFEGYARQLMESNGAVASIIGVRVLAFSLIRFAFQRMRNGRGTNLFGTPALSLLEVPYEGGTTQDMLMRMMMDCDLAGNSYMTRAIGPYGPMLVRMRPDWVQIMLMPILARSGERIGWQRVGYTYHEGGIEQCRPEDVALFATNEVSHFAPDPDPFGTYRGQSWLTSVLREIVNDKAMERHKTRFFENAATPNISVALSDSVTPEQFAAFKAKMDVEHRGVDNAYKTLYLGGGADVKVIGAQLHQIDFATIQGRGETRMAARAGVPSILVGLSEGMSASTYNNYSSAMRRFGDLTMASLWSNVAGSMATLVPPPGSDSRLWYDARDVAFLREDSKARADVAQVKATTINVYITAGFTPESAVAAAAAEDETLLVHTGMVSVQLQPPGTPNPGAPGTPTPAAVPAPAATNAAPPEGGAHDDGPPLDAVDRTLRTTSTNGKDPSP